MLLFMKLKKGLLSNSKLFLIKILKLCNTHEIKDYIRSILVIIEKNKESRITK
jgi:hypothetical protein